MPGTGDRLLGQRMKQRRLGLGLEHSDVAKAITPNVAPRTVRAYEDGANAPASIEALRQIAEVLRTTVAYLIGETDNVLRPEDRLRRAGFDVGNFDGLSDEEFALQMSQIVEDAFSVRSRQKVLQPPRRQGERNEGGGQHGAAGASSA